MIKAPKNTFKYTVFVTDFGVYDVVKNFVGFNNLKIIMISYILIY